jgi:dTDP-4-amino-4,6-dideoxygalactose transaminase
VIPFAKADIGVEEVSAVMQVLESGWLTSGDWMRKLEAAVSGYLGGVNAIAVNSATSGLHLALEAMGIGPGDEVLVPTLTFAATAEAVRYVRATPVFCDINPHTLNLDVGDAESRITPRTRAIIPVHYGGLACEMGQVWSLAIEYDLKVIEDAAHALGSTYRGSPIGAGLSDAVVYSFYATKCITTGEGGMVVTTDKTLAHRMRTMRLHGIDRDAFDRYRKPGSWEYDVVDAGFKYNLPDILAAIGVAQFERMEEMRANRENIARIYYAALSKLPMQLPKQAEDCQHSWHLYAVCLPLGVQRDQFIEVMKDLGVMCSVHYKPLHRMTYWSQYARGTYPFADAVWPRLVSLPIYSGMEDTEVSKVIWAVEEALQRCARSLNQTQVQKLLGRSLDLSNEDVPAP